MLYASLNPLGTLYQSRRSDRDHHIVHGYSGQCIQRAAYVAGPATTVRPPLGKGHVNASGYEPDDATGAGAG